jgi:putative cardiolipin synthase
MKSLILTCFLALGMFNFASATVYDYSSNNSIELLKDAKESADLKLSLIRNAKHHIHIMTYFLDNSSFPSVVFQELLKANERGVEVRILSTFVPTFAKDLRMKTKKKLKGKNADATFLYLLLGTKGNVSLLNNLHEKIFLVDGETAIIGGRNLSDSAFRAKDLEVLLKGSVVDQLQTHFQKMLDVLLEREIDKKCDHYATIDLECRNHFLQGRFDLIDDQYFKGKDHNGKIRARLLSHNAVLNQISHKMNRRERLVMTDDIVDAVVATKFKTMRAYNYYVLPTEKYRNFLTENVKNGNDIKIITNSLKTSAIVSNKGYLYSLPIIHDLVDDGVKIYQWQGPTNYEYLHEKVIVFDEEKVFIGSHNFGTGSTAMSNEIAIEFEDRDIAIDLINIFDEEINNNLKTKSATNKSIASEIAENIKMVRFLQKTVLGEILEESY